MKIAALNNNLQQRKSAEATIAKNDAALKNARAQSLKSQADLKRVKELTADGSLSIRERDAALASAAQGSADIDQAKAALEMSRQDLQTVIVNRGALEADVENAKAALELAQIDLQNTRIVAPRDGQLGQIAVRLGAYVTAGTHLTTLVPPQHWVIANIKETQLAELRVGQPVKFTVDALNNKAYQGRVESISRRPAWSSAPSRRITPPATLSKLPSVFRCALRCSVSQRSPRCCVRVCRCR
jgi:multidrug resistance efflux pump